MTYIAFLQFTALLSNIKFYNPGQTQPGCCISRAAVKNTVDAKRGTRGSWQYCLAYCWQDGFLHVLEGINFPPRYRNILQGSWRDCKSLHSGMVSRENCHREANHPVSIRLETERCLFGAHQNLLPSK